MEFYIGWMDRILSYKSRVHTFYLDTIGFNKPNMVNFMQNLILSKTNNGGQGGLPNASSENQREINAFHLLKGLMGMEIEKAKIFDVPLPDEYQKIVDENVIEAEVSDEDDRETVGSKAKRNGKTH